jgi:hypothetical protein
MPKQAPRLAGRWPAAALSLCLGLFMAGLLLSTWRAQATVPHLGYGFNVAAWDVALLQSMGFNWMKVFDPPASPQPVPILLRVQADAGNMGDLPAFSQQMAQLAANHGAYIDAYEIGNEPNLDASYGWAAPPVAADYAALLCVAFSQIKQIDPTAIIVSAGLAPTGRVSGTWNGHPGHNGLYQDEREFLREFLAAGGGECADVIGYHPYGFSADYNAAPDVPSADPTQNCTNGFCFRGTEKIYEIMQDYGYGHKKVWATEFGWIVAPPAYCLSDPGWQGRLWQIVTEAKQASNLAGAFAYADANWPWMGGMFVFNLNFNVAGQYPECEQMRFYAVKNRPAENTLRAAPKNPATIGPNLLAAPGAVLWLVEAAAQPADLTAGVYLANGGWTAVTYTAAALTPAEVVPDLLNPVGVVGPTGQAILQLATSVNRPMGIYTGLLQVDGQPTIVGGPRFIPVTIRVVDTIYRSYFPHISR